MNRVLLDANVVISFLLERNRKQQADAAGLFENAAAGRIGVVFHQHALAETVYVLLNVYGRPPDEVAGIVSDLLSMPGIERQDALNERVLFELWPHSVRDFGDAVLAAVALEARLGVATFDRRLSNALRRLGAGLYSWR